ncbi:MAG: LemA family protein [Firmicutes bacterium]|nr:LemA family protein [Bacillota bacterium]
MTWINILLIIIIILSLGGIYYIIAFNKLNDLKTKVLEAENIIDENLRIKYDALIRISNSLKKHMKTNKNYFKEYEKLKDMKITNFDMDRSLNEGYTLILKMRDDLNLEKDEELNKELENIKRLDEKLTAAKNYYNKNTSLENAIIRRFPTNVIAKIHNFKIKLFFDGKDMDDEIIDDFKI